MFRRSLLFGPGLVLAGRKRNSGSRLTRLSAHASKPTRTIAPGLHPLGLAPKRDAFLYVPASYVPRKALPLVISLHGAGGTAERAIRPMQALAEKYGFLALAPDSRGTTWDAVAGEPGPDVQFLDAALTWVFDRCSIDAHRSAVSGFSDGATYALTLGLANGDLFSHVLAFSPGFLFVPDRNGKPEIFISHGTSDRVLPIDRCSRIIVPRLKNAGYAVNYVEFEGSHQVPADIREAGVRWFVRT